MTTYNLLKHPDLWLHDGNVMIRAYQHPTEFAGPGICYEFRVHASILATHSTWWARAFTLAGYDIPDIPAREPRSRRNTCDQVHWTGESSIKCFDAGFDAPPADFAALIMRIYRP